MSQRLPRGPSICAACAVNRSGAGTDTCVFGFSSVLITAAAMSDGSTGLIAPPLLVPEISSVLVNGGMMTETSTPCGAISSASAADNPTTPNFAPT